MKNLWDFQILGYKVEEEEDSKKRNSVPGYLLTGLKKTHEHPRWNFVTHHILVSMSLFNFKKKKLTNEKCVGFILVYLGPLTGVRSKNILIRIRGILDKNVYKGDNKRVIVLEVDVDGHYPF